MSKIPTQTFDLLKDGQYVLRIKHMEEPKRSDYLGEPQLQIQTTIEVIEAISPGTEKMTDDQTPAVGETFLEYLSLDPRTGAVKMNSKLWQIYEAATGLKLDTDDEIDTDDLIGKDFQAKVVANDPGTRNRTEHGSYGKAKKSRGGKDEVKKEPEPDVIDEGDFEAIPY